MSRKAAKIQQPNYLRRSLKFNHHLFKEDEFEEEQSEEEIEEDSYEGEEDFDYEEFEEIEESEESEKEFEEEESEEYTEEEFDEKYEDEFEDEFDEKSEEEFNEESEDKFDERSEEEFDEESEEHTEEESEDQLEDEFDEKFEEEIDEKSEDDFDEKSEDQSEEECEENSKEQSEEEDFEDEFEEEESEEEGEELKMALVNARSIIKFINRGDRTLIDLIQDNDLDVLLITETWLPTENLTNADFRTILPPKYNIIDEPRFYGRGGGVAIIYHRNLICKKVQFAFPSAFEFVAAAVRQPGSKDTVLILSIYRPPGGSITEFSNNFLSELHLLLCDVYARYENVIIGGDFNIWFDCPEMTVIQEFEGFMHENSLVQHVWRPTHEGGHVLDLVLSNLKVRISNVSVRKNRFSDHSTILFKARI